MPQARRPHYAISQAARARARGAVLPTPRAARRAARHRVRSAAIATLLVALLAAPAQAVEVSGRTLTLSEAEASQCAQEDGCRVISNKAVEGLLPLGFAKGYEAGVETCKGKT